MVRRVMLFAVVLGVMSVSIHGQVKVTEPLLGFRFAVTLAVVLDVGALLALNEVLTTSTSEVRRWGWTALLLASGLSVGLNVWHAVDSGTLPLVAAIAVGAVPVVLAGVLSHLLALSLAAERKPPVDETAGTTGTSAPGTGTAGAAGTGPGGTSGRYQGVVPAQAGTDPVIPAATGIASAGTSTAAGAGTAAAAVRDVPPPVPIRRAAAAGGRRPTPPARKELTARSAAVRAPGKGADPSLVEELPPAAAALWDRARELDVRHRREHGTPAPRRLLMETLGIGTSTAAPLHRALAAAAQSDDQSPGTGGPDRGIDTAGQPGTSTAGTDTTAAQTGTDTGTTGETGQAVPAAGTSRRLELVNGGTNQTTVDDQPGTTGEAEQTTHVAEVSR